MSRKNNRLEVSGSSDAWLKKLAGRSQFAGPLGMVSKEQPSGTNLEAWKRPATASQRFCYLGYPVLEAEDIVGQWLTGLQASGTGDFIVRPTPDPPGLHILSRKDLVRSVQTPQAYPRFSTLSLHDKAAYLLEHVADRPDPDQPDADQLGPIKVEALRCTHPGKLSQHEAGEFPAKWSKGTVGLILRDTPDNTSMPAVLAQQDVLKSTKVYPDLISRPSKGRYVYVPLIEVVGPYDMQPPFLPIEAEIKHTLKPLTPVELRLGRLGLVMADYEGPVNAA